MSFSPLCGYNPPARRPIVLADLRYPLGASLKHDGFRVLRRRGKALSRYLKPVRNLELRALIEGCSLLECCEGEVIYGDPTDPESFHRTSSLATRRHGGVEGMRLYLFDWFARPELGYRARWAQLKLLRLPKWCEVIGHKVMMNAAQAQAYEEWAVGLGYEGMMLRELDGTYKHGRSTLREQLLLKVKRMEDSEAVVLDMRPKMRNDNERTRDALGRSVRSSRREGKVATLELGSLLLRDAKGLHGGREFSCAPGVLTQAQKLEIFAAWRRGEIGKRMRVKYRFQPAGTGELPRFPRLHGVLSGLKFRSA